MLQAALNGDRDRTAHPAVPLSRDELVRDAVACVAAGAKELHLHPRDGEGRESLEPTVIDAVASRVRAACGAPVGVSTGAWIEPDLERRIALVRSWSAPDYASVNVSEPGFEKVLAALLEAGVGVEAGVWSVEDAERLAAAGPQPHLVRVLVEPVTPPPDRAVEIVAGIHAALDAAGVVAPRLQHGDGPATWRLIDDAAHRGLATRVGLEDVLVLPDGSPARDNAALVATAAARIQSAGSLAGSVTYGADDDLTRPIDIAWDARDGAA
ncbi:3-keto-5-aminohexanoate cleavage protein [Patulibacter americanus]|uniref:3-keto-5-aminohexanoate cleavage protein n=1 Tax=Patulibacter americanus TaxID=588672 RepID=UPI0003B5B5B5|nr:3-keto-5-aminohexanoate cleavage protein [Patulibacter americanus]